MALNDDQPAIALPAEALYAALLETQAPVPFERTSSNGSQAPAAAALEQPRLP